ncbi:MAG TPA: hypothetical protein VGK50_00765 [Coriobacteriia bacterium]|jgi:hypothetical protein
MVARGGTGGDAPPVVASAVSALFLAWRRALTAILRALASLWRRTTSAVPRGRSLGVAGGVSLAMGAVLSLALARPLRMPLAEVAVAVVWTLGWAGLRLGILRLAAPRTSPGRVRAAWAAGLLPAAFGVTDVLRVLALAASAWLTLGALEGGGVPRREARRAAAVAFGAEAAAAVVRWVAASALLYVSAVR